MTAARFLLVLMIGGLPGCVDTGKPLFGPETRVVPFQSGTQFQVYSRNQSGQPWRHQSKIKAFRSDADNVIRMVDESGKPSDEERYTLHRIGTDHFMLQFERAGIFSDGIVEYRNNEAIVTMFDCRELDQRASEAIGGRVSPDGEHCSLDAVQDPVGVLKGLALLANRAQERYVTRSKLTRADCHDPRAAATAYLKNRISSNYNL
jgi:hypothetical protein